MKDESLLQRIRWTGTCVLAASLLLSCAAVANAADKDDGWHATITPFVWIPKLDGTLRVEPPAGLTGGGNLPIGPSSYLSNLKFPLMVDFVVRKKKWSVGADVLYVRFEDPDKQATIPPVLAGGAGLTIKANTSLKALLFTPAVSYSLFRGEKGNFDVLAGFRYLHMDSKIGLDVTGLPPSWASSKNRDKTQNYTDPVIGFQGKFDLSKRWFVPYYFDIGGFGLDSDITLQAKAGVGFRIAKWFAMDLNYRYLHYNIGGQKLVNTLDLYGPIIGFNFTF